MSKYIVLRYGPIKDAGKHQPPNIKPINGLFSWVTVRTFMSYQEITKYSEYYDIIEHKRDV